MSNPTVGRWLLVALAILGLALVATSVSAHGADTGTDEAPPANATAAEWAAWMHEHLTAEEIAWMEQHSGLTLEAMAEHMAEDGHWDGDHWVGDGYHHGPGHLSGDGSSGHHGYGGDGRYSGPAGDGRC
ncbi:MAG: hypothetical protein ABEJ92_10780 [Halobacteriales archaeon]